MMERDAIREKLGDTATALDAAYVGRKMGQLGITVGAVAGMSEREWLAMVDAALEDGANELRDVLRRHDIGIDWHKVEGELRDRRLMDAIVAWHHASDKAVAGTGETRLASGWHDMVDAIERASDPIAKAMEQIGWWYRAYRALDDAMSEPGQPRLERVCEELLGSYV